MRFTLLHELGHLLLKFEEQLTENEKEKLCHQFAGSMLLPKNILREELGNHRARLSVIEIGNIKKQYGVSMQALVYRANILGIVNDHYTSQFFNMMKQMGWRKEEPKDRYNLFVFFLSFSSSSLRVLFSWYCFVYSSLP